MARVGFEPRPCWSQARRFNHSTTLPTMYVPKVHKFYSLCLIIIQIDVENDDTLWPPLTNGKGRKEKKKKKNSYHNSALKDPFNRINLTSFLLLTQFTYSRVDL